jgi:hypothetical protein
MTPPKIISPLEGLSALPQGLSLWDKHHSLAQEFLGTSWDVFGVHSTRKRILTLSPYPFTEQQKDKVKAVFGWQTKPGVRFLGQLPVSYVRGDMKPNVVLCLSFIDNSTLFLQRMPNNSSNFIMTLGLVFQRPDPEIITGEHLNFVMSTMNDRTIAGPTFIQTTDKDKGKNKALAFSRTFGEHHSPIHTFSEFQPHDDAVTDALTLCTHTIAHRLFAQGAKVVKCTLNGRLYTQNGERTSFDLHVQCQGVSKSYAQSVKNNLLSGCNQVAEYLTQISDAHSTKGLEGVCFDSSGYRSPWREHCYYPEDILSQEELDTTSIGLYRNFAVTPWSKHQTMAHASGLSARTTPELAHALSTL